MILDLKAIQELIDDFNASPTRELEIKTADFQLRLSKNELSAKLLERLTQPRSNETAKSVEIQKNKPLNKVQKYSVIKAPLVGSIYLQPAPGKGSYVQVGGQIKKGDVVCVIEAMKVMTEIKSSYSGLIKKILVKNEELVEYGQPLFEIEEQ
jgi:acetyl-CoA carboxylase biotin carboxyl carrier protein